jgi:hypothetical protein
VPPLTLGQLRRLIPKVRQMTDVGAAMGEVEIGTLVELVTAALSRNYPDLTDEHVEHLLDLGNASNVLSIILTGSGIKSTGEGRARAAETDFASIYGVLATGCGYRYRDIDEMTLLDFMELCSYWEKSPPVHIMVAAYLGVRKDANPPANPRRPDGGPSPFQTSRPDSAAALDRKVSADEAAMIFGAMGHVGCGMIESIERPPGVRHPGNAGDVR